MLLKCTPIPSCSWPRWNINGSLFSGVLRLPYIVVPISFALTWNYQLSKIHVQQEPKYEPTRGSLLLLHTYEHCFFFFLDFLFSLFLSLHYLESQIVHCTHIYVIVGSCISNNLLIISLMHKQNSISK